MERLKETVKIGKIDFEKFPKQNETMQDFVKRTLHKLFDSDLISQKELENLQNDEYGKSFFSLPCSLLKNDWSKCLDNDGHERYWKFEHFNKSFYCCNNWYNMGSKTKEKKALEQLEYFANWLEYLAKENVNV